VTAAAPVGRRSAKRFDFIGSAFSSFGLHRFARIAENSPGREILAAVNRLESRFETRTVRFELLPDLEVSSVPSTADRRRSFRKLAIR
jgi:hypothetical protein